MKSWSGEPGRKHAKREFKREMRARAREDHRNAWTQSDASGPRAVGPSFALPLLGLFEFALVVSGLWAVAILVTQRAVLGVSLPEGVPLWVGVVALVFAFHVALWPIKAVRHTLHATMTGRTMSFASGFLDSLVWLAAVVVGIWLADHYIPGVHEFLVALPGKINQVLEVVRQWWSAGAKDVPLEAPAS